MRLGGVLALRTGAVIAATVATAVLLSVALSELKFEQKLREVAASRLTVVADEMRRRVEYGLTLGLDLSELVDLQAQAERAASGGEILGVEVVDDRGIVLFAADRTAVGQSGLARWGGESGGTLRRRIDGDVLVIGSGVRNSFGQTVGEVVLRSSLAGLRARVAVVEEGLYAGTLALVGLAALATLAGVFLILWHQGRRGGGRRVGGRHDLAAGSAPLTLVRGRLTRGIAEAERALEELERELDAMLPPKGARS
ncbi:hypothetical protein TSH100_20040 [Azospirillum sp. TSH100]|uniref:hypothetical protein n=1 Tax=Azospirillum sp. TSH100 TaxID=652764 RepID=UPI000D605755|nr:hypothetical protein [Azospirillum sp. TSH100]PWC83848.1 hypothetical protein TSH100_20040 [Azospirillum sp. TSH100]QCG88385.1 hypothetical protein E6C72_12055 [Azospirillum sp. TSH100]